MKKTLGKTLWLIAGMLLVFVGAITIVNPAKTISTIAYVLGCAVLLAGVFDLVIFAVMKDTLFGQKWVLKDGVINIILAILLLCNNLLAANAIAYIFAMWIIMAGINRFMTSVELKKLKTPGWIWLSILGIIGIAVGFMSFFDPIVSMFVSSVIIGIILILYGATLLVLWWYIQQMN